MDTKIDEVLIEGDGEGEESEELVEPKEKLIWNMKEKFVRENLSERRKNLLPTMFHYVDKYAAEKPSEIAYVEIFTGEEITWGKLKTATDAFAALLYNCYGVKKGDVIVTSLPVFKEHIYLMIACLRLGAIYVPMDMRLASGEICRNFDSIKPKMYFHLGKTPIKDFSGIVKEVMKTHHSNNGGSVKYWVQFQKEPKGILDGSIFIKDFVKCITFYYLWDRLMESFCCGGFRQIQKDVDTRDPAFIIHTTGSTGFSKPALLCNEGVLHQLCGIVTAWVEPAIKFNERDFLLLINLPPSHIAGLDQILVPIYMGKKAIIMHIFNPKGTLEAVEKYKVTSIAQIPALYSLEWKTEGYENYDLSSLNVVLYGGQSVSKEFLQKMKDMCGEGSANGGGTVTGLGLTEYSGFGTYSSFDGTVEEISSSLGFDSNEGRITVRKSMNEDRTAGECLPSGEVGEICFEGPQVFLGYYNLPEQTEETVSKDGVLYTGDMGSYDDNGLHFVSRRKFVIKPKGYQVYPPEVEGFILDAFDKEIMYCGIVGVEHDSYSEGVVAVIKLKEGSKLTSEEIHEVVKSPKGLASYKRPSLYVFLGDEIFPLNRIGKTDYLQITEIAKEHVKKERLEGRWDGKKE